MKLSVGFLQRQPDIWVFFSKSLKFFLPQDVLNIVAENGNINTFPDAFKKNNGFEANVVIHNEQSVLCLAVNIGIKALLCLVARSPLSTVISI